MTAVETSTDPVARTRHRSKPRRRLSAGTASLTILGLLVALVAAAVLTGRYQVRPVLTGSMRPGLSVGGIVVTKKVPLDDIKVRDVIVFHRPDKPSELVVHRVISLTRTGSTVTVKTQGDANDAPDPWTVHLRGDTAYRAVFSVPLLGYPAVWFHSADGQREILVLFGLVIALVAFVMWRRERRRPTASDADPKTADDEPSTDDPTSTENPTSTDVSAAKHRPTPHSHPTVAREPVPHLADF